MIVRVKQDRSVTVIDNQAIEDRRLSWRALGLLAWLLSRPPSWTGNEHDIAHARSDGVEPTRAALRELDRAGYIERLRSRENGRDVWVGEVGAGAEG